MGVLIPHGGVSGGRRDHLRVCRYLVNFSLLPPQGPCRALSHPVHLLDPPDGVMAARTSRDPTFIRQTSPALHDRRDALFLLRSAQGGWVVKLLFLCLQCKICQLGTVDRLPLCSFNCLPCVKASVCVCACFLGEACLLAWAEEELISEDGSVPCDVCPRPQPREAGWGGIRNPLWESGDLDSGPLSAP